MSNASDTPMKFTTKALWHLTKSKSILKEVELNISYDTIIQSSYSLISAGTEKLVATGLVPEKLHETMKVPYMEGALGLPVKYGYSVTGRIVSSGIFEKDALVHIMHPHQDLICADAKNCTLIPAFIPLKRATLVANMETVVNAIWDANLTHNNSILIAGYGTVGALLARVCKTRFNAHVDFIERNEDRINALKMHGYQLASIEKYNYDIAFNCSASNEALQYCIDHVDEEGSIIELSWYGDIKVTLSLGETFHSMRKKIISSQVSNIPKSKRAEWNYEKRKQLAFEYLKDPFFDYLITDEIPFEETPHFFERLRNDNLNGIGYCIKY
jgi:threonine dehydrogenase-like Zn-dependent dehydrogenase